MSELPISVAQACTLPTAQRPARSAEWGSIFREVVTTESLDAQWGRLVFPRDAALETRIRDLVAKETACCSFFTFELGDDVDAAGAQTITLDVGVPPSRSAVLDAFIAWADCARTGRLA